MSQQELLTLAVRVLVEAGIDYMVTGSFASSAQGEPRLSHDIDLVANITIGAVAPLVKAFPPPDYYLSEAAIHSALQNHSMFNLLHTSDGGKVDFWVLTDEPFDRSRFARKTLAEIQGSLFFVSAPEDTILAKLRWAKLSGGSEKQFIDALRVYEVQATILDMEYLNRWAKELEVEESWKRLQEEAEPV